MLKDQTVKWDQGDMFWTRWKAEPALYTHIRKYELLRKRRQAPWNIFQRPWDNIVWAKLQWATAGCWSETAKFPHDGNRWLVLCFWVVSADLYFLNKPVSWGVIIGCRAASVSDLYVWVKVLTVSYQLCELTCEPYTHKNGENICITVIFLF